jgi:hypothetical protein
LGETEMSKAIKNTVFLVLLAGAGIFLQYQYPVASINAWIIIVFMANILGYLEGKS